MMAITIFIWFPILVVRGHAASPDRQPDTRRIVRLGIPNQVPCQTAMCRKPSLSDGQTALQGGKMSNYCAQTSGFMMLYSALPLCAPMPRLASQASERGLSIQKRARKNRAPKVGWNSIPTGFHDKDNQPLVNSG
jgi:hypothetical protein